MWTLLALAVAAWAVFATVMLVTVWLLDIGDRRRSRRPQRRAEAPAQKEGPGERT